MSDNNLIPMTERIEELRKEGYKDDFKMQGNKFVNSGSGKDFKPSEIVIEKEYRFEGDSNPDDMSILYAIAADSGEKGIAVNGYGLSANADMDQFLNECRDRTQ
jgi:hypothetical protein